MKKLLVLILFLFLINSSSAQKLTPYEKGNTNQTVTYSEMVQFYNDLAATFSSIKIFTKGADDNGEPIRVVVFNPDSSFEFPNKTNKAVLLINNGIHPGEPDGIDATMMLFRDLAEGKIQPPKNVIITAIQSYNISGMLNRGKFSRANQNGPEEYGFRGNTRNFDLNRDFIKADSKNAVAFQELFQLIKPDYFIDNHVSNGADYQYLLTYISTNKERLGTTLGNYLNKDLQPQILKGLDLKKILHIPYVNIHGDSPDEGFPAFMDSPRYATGYTSLFNVPGTVVETHMLKPYNERVFATYKYMISTIDFMEKDTQVLKTKIKENRKQYSAGKSYPIQWKLDSTKVSSIHFKGYEAGQKSSKISGKPRLFYDRSVPFQRKVKFYDSYMSTKEIKIPKFYIVPQSEWKVIEHLKRNKIQFSTLRQDSLISVETYRIEDFKTVKNPYEGHYLHYDTEVSSSKEHLKFRKGDLLVSTNQDGVKYLLETLEPEAVDSFFNWNFFDGILGQKEYYSDYVFEDTAAELLETNQKLKSDFQKKKFEDSAFANDGKAQLDWIYKNSPYFEKTYRLYPIYRIQ